jgi:hypothetical protein
MDIDTTPRLTPARRAAINSAVAANRSDRRSSW